MTDAEQIRRAAIRAGLMGMNGTSVAMHKLEAFASILLDEENEACAQVSAGTADRWSDNTGVANAITEAIRARRKA